MMAKRSWQLMGPFLTVLAFSAASSPGFAQERFYEGETIRFIVGFSAGGGFDTYTRAIARHIGKHIPGNPTTIVENMGGAASLIAANHIYNQAKADGLTIGNWIGGLILQQYLGAKGVTFDAAKFEWIGAPVQINNVCVFTKKSGITSVDKWLASKTPIKIGAEGPGSTTADIPRILIKYTKLPIQPPVDPDILLMDEPFASLDAQTREITQRDLMQLWTVNRKTVLFVTHQIDEAVLLADRVIVLSNKPARIKADLQVDLARPRHLEVKWTPDFLRLTSKVWKLIQEEVTASAM